MEEPYSKGAHQRHPARAIDGHAPSHNKEAALHSYKRTCPFPMNVSASLPLALQRWARLLPLPRCPKPVHFNGYLWNAVRIIGYLYLKTAFYALLWVLSQIQWNLSIRNKFSVAAFNISMRGYCKSCEIETHFLVFWILSFVKTILPFERPDLSFRECTQNENKLQVHLWIWKNRVVRRKYHLQ